MRRKVNIGVIGLGGVAQVVHLPLLHKNPDANIAGLVEINKNRLNTISEKYGVKKKYMNHSELLEDPSVDAVIIATPTDTHYQIGMDAIAAGKHVLIEKPIARNYDETKKLVEAAEEKNVKLMVGMNLRFRPDVMLLRSLINSGELGDIFYIRCGWIRKQSSQQDWFLKKEKAGGGVIIDLGITLLDLAHWLMDNKKIVSVSVQKFNTETTAVEDSSVGFIRLEDNSVINFEVSWTLHSDKNTLNLAAYGKHGTAHINPLCAYRRVGSTHIDLSPPTVSSDKNMFKKSYDNELKHFIASILQDNVNKIHSSGREALTRMKLLEAIYKSAELNKEVMI